MPIPLDEFLQMPYDCFCPSVQSDLKDRCCKTCSIYFASKKSAALHMRNLKHTLSWRKQTSRLKSILQKRDKELLCVVGVDQTNEENVEWIDKEEAQDYDNFKDVNEKFGSEPEVNPTLPIIDSVNDWLKDTFVEE